MKMYLILKNYDVPLLCWSSGCNFCIFLYVCWKLGQSKGGAWKWHSVSIGISQCALIPTFFWGGGQNFVKNMWAHKMRPEKEGGKKRKPRKVRSFLQDFCARNLEAPGVSGIIPIKSVRFTLQGISWNFTRKKGPKKTILF